MAETELVPGNVGLMVKGNPKEKKRNHIKVVAPGSAIDRYEKEGVVGNQDVVRAVRGRRIDKGKGKARSTSVPTRKNSEEMSQEADMGFCLDLFKNTPAN